MKSPKWANRTKWKQNQNKIKKEKKWKRHKWDERKNETQAHNAKNELWKEFDQDVV